MQPQLPELSWARRPLHEVLRLAWPTIISLLSVSTMTLVDTLFIGRLGSSELAAAGLGGVCVFTILSFGMASIAAAKVKVGERQGQGDRAAVERALGSFLRLSVWLGTLSAVAGFLAAWSLIGLSADLRTGQLASEYAAIRAFSFPIVLVGHALSQWLQAQGDSQAGMRAALLANVVNAPLNALLIFGLSWGITGAAVATACSSLLEAGYLVLLQYRRGARADLQSGAPGHFNWRAGSLERFHWYESTWADSWKTFLIGLPTGLERVFDMMAFAAVPLLLAQVNPVQVAAHQIVLQVMLFSFLPLLALSDAVTVLVSQAVGARLQRLVTRLHHIGLVLSGGYALICAGLCAFFSQGLAELFTAEMELRQIAADTLVIGALLQLLNAPYVHFKGVLRGLSSFRFVAAITVGCAWLITPPLTYLWGVQQGHGARGAWFALCVEVTCGVVLCQWRGRKVSVALVSAAE